MSVLIIFIESIKKFNVDKLLLFVHKYLRDFTILEMPRHHWILELSFMRGISGRYWKFFILIIV